MSQSDTSASRVDTLSSSLPSSTSLSSSSTVTSPVSGVVDSSSGPIVSQPFSALATESNGTIFTTATKPGTVPSLNPNICVQILEALCARNRDRSYVLELGEIFEALIKDDRLRTRVVVPHSTSYQRLLIHRCSAYYKLQLETDPVNKALYVMLTSESRIPERRICELVPAESSTQPGLEPRSKPQSHTGLVAGDEETDLSVVEPSKSVSTFKGVLFERKKGKDMHALTNTFHQDPMGKRGEFSASASSSRALSFHGNSFRNTSQKSPATSPSFSYPTLYEQTSYDAPHNAANPEYHPAQYVYPSPYPSQLNPSYLTPYTYDASPYSMPQRNPSDSSPGWVPQPPANQPMQPNPHSMHPPTPPHHQDPINQSGWSFFSPPPRSPPYKPNPSYLIRPPGQQQPPPRRGVAPSASSPTRRFGPGIPIGVSPYFVGEDRMNESVDAMFNSLNIRTSHNTTSGGNSRVVSSSRNSDDVSSTASSSSNSSSQRTYYTSSTSSLPRMSSRPRPRPDWAVGLKVQPTLVDRQQNNLRDMSPISPSKSNGQDSPHSDNCEELVIHGRSSVEPNC